MSGPTHKSLTITVDESIRVSGILTMPPRARACYVLAHGAGAGMNHPFMAAVAEGLAARRYRHPALSVSLYGARLETARCTGTGARDGSRRCGRCGAAQAQIAADRRRQIVWRADDLADASRDAVTVQAGLAFLGFPLHPAGRPSSDRARHLFRDKNPDAVPAGHARQSCRSERTHVRYARSLAGARR